MKKTALKIVLPSVLLFVLAMLTGTAFGQTVTMSTSGDWDNASNWTSGNIGNAITENVTLSGNTSPTVTSGFSYTIGNLSGSGDNTITVAGSLTLGASGTPKNLSLTGNNPKITVTGTLIIWGNATFTNKVVWDIRGTVIIKGNLQLNGGTDLDVKNGASLVVEGSFSAGNNTDVKVNGSGGSVQVYQNVNVGTGNLNVSAGTFEYGGTCNSSNANFCNNATHNATLPIKLIFLNAVPTLEGVELTWATATEENFDRFVIEHSANGKDFQIIGEQTGHGNTKERQDYAFTHGHPVVGKNYYRLKFVDFDNAFEYSSIVFASFEGGKQISVFPNPTNGISVNILLNFDYQFGDKIEVLDNLGAKLQEEDVSGILQSVNLNHLVPGTYHLRYVGSDYTKVIRFTVK